jgi:hypothetical protein
MTEFVKETVITQNDGADAVAVTPVKVLATNSQTVEYLVYFFLEHWKHFWLFV